MNPVTKPIIKYENLDEFRAYLSSFIKEKEDATDPIMLDYEKLDFRVVNGIGLFLLPEIFDSRIGDFKIQTNIYTNLNVRWFAKRTRLEDKIYSEIVHNEEKSSALVLSHHLYEGGKPLSLLSGKRIKESLNKSAYETNKIIDDLFGFYGISHYNEREVVFDFQLMKKIREKDFNI